MVEQYYPRTKTFMLWNFSNLKKKVILGGGGHIGGLAPNLMFAITVEGGPRK